MYSVQESGDVIGFSGHEQQRDRHGRGDSGRGGRGKIGGRGEVAGRGIRGEIRGGRGGRGQLSPQQLQGGGGRGGGKLVMPPAVARRLFTSEATLATAQPLWRYIDLHGAVQARPRSHVCEWQAASRLQMLYVELYHCTDCSYFN